MDGTNLESTYRRDFTMTELFDLCEIVCDAKAYLRHEIGRTENAQLKAIYQNRLNAAEHLTRRLLNQAEAA